MRRMHMAKLEQAPNQRVAHCSQLYNTGGGDAVTEERAVKRKVAGRSSYRGLRRPMNVADAFHPINQLSRRPWRRPGYKSRGTLYSSNGPSAAAMGKTTAAKGGLKQLAKDVDDLKLQIDAHVKECDKFLSNPAAGANKQRSRDLHARSVDLRRNVASKLEIVQKLQKADEPVASQVPRDYEGRKADETDRLRRLLQHVAAIEEKLRPDEVEEDYLKTAKDQLGRRSPGEDTFYEESVEDEEEDEEEEDDKEEEEEEEEEEISEDDDRKRRGGSKPSSGAPKPARKDDDNKHVGEEEETEEEEEEEEMDDEEGSSGEGEDEEVSENVDGGLSSVDTTLNMQYEALDDYDPERRDELRLKRGDVVTLVYVRDDGWWECENDDGQRGLVPSTYMKEYDKYKSLRSAGVADQSQQLGRSTSRASVSWAGVKQSLEESGATDVLHALGAVPSGFRAPTLARMHSEGQTFRMENYLAPKLSPSNLYYKDLFYSPTGERIRPRAARVQKIVSLVACRQVPLPGSDTEVRSRWARLCLFNGTTVLSNIHTVRAHASDREGKSWAFSTKLQDVMRTLEHGEAFVRAVGATKNLGVLIELSVSFVKVKTGQQCELACGWIHIPLLNEDGSVIPNKQQDYILNGGTPYEKGVEVDPSIGRRPTSKFKSLISRNRQPLITVRISNPSKEQRDQLDLLPETLVSNTCYLQHISLYRSALAETLLHDKIDLTSAEPVFKPFLVHFPSAVEQPDLMDVLRSSWIEKLQASRHLNKQDLGVMTWLLQSVFMEWIYPLMHLYTLPAFVYDDGPNEQARQTVIDKSLQLVSGKRNPLASLLSPDVMYEPIETDELTYSVIGPYCLEQLAAQG